MNELRDVPYNIEAEQSVLGTMIADPRTIDDVMELLGAGDFYRGDHRVIFAAILDIHAQGNEPDVVTLVEALRGESIEVAYVGGLVRNAYRSGNVKAYADIVRSKAIDRRLIAAARDIHQIADRTASTAEKIDRAQSLVMAIDEAARSGDTGPRAIKAILPGVVDDLEARFNDGNTITGLSTGFVDLDKNTSGLQPADLIILAARPSMGKTTLAMNIAESAVRSGCRVAVFSMEMPQRQIAARALCSIGGVDFQRFRSGQLHGDEWPKVTQAMAQLSDSGLFVDDSGGLTVHELSARARKLHRKGALGLVVVDYLQLMRGEGENQTQKIAEISRGLKRLAKELNAPVLALSQLNRDVERRANKRPTMSDLRDSGAIEQDADLIAFIYRDEVYNDDSGDKGTAEIIIGKQRNGPIGMVRLVFQGQYLRFRDCLDYKPQPTGEEKPKRYAHGFEY